MKNSPQKSATASTPLPSLGFDPSEMMQGFTSKTGDISVFGGFSKNGWLDLQQHSMNFLSNRFKQDAELFNKLKSCSNTSEMTQACSDFYTGAAEDYQTQVAKLTTLG
ncbi:hypothetical protein [Planktotalea arctica]|uniref:hypothetical protein n=1 Tax=Planktotalea arctica TaxID=1481893 RepID=UPI00321BA69A